MGSGSSRGGSQLVVAKTVSKAKQNEHQTHVRKEPPKLTESQAQVAKSNKKKQDDKPTQVHTTTEYNNESSRGEGNVKQTTAKTGVVSGPTKTATAENNSESSNGEGNLKQTTTDSDVANDSTKLTMEKTVHEKPDCAGLLTSYCEQYPQIKESLTKTLGYFQNLKELFDSGNMISPKIVELAKGFFVLLDNIEAPSDKARLTDFTVSLGAPKLFCDTITHLRSQLPELTKWDRAEDLEKKETKETPASDQDESQDKEKVDREKELTIAQDTVNLLAGSVLDFSDLHDDYCVACGQAGMVPVFVEMTKELEDSIAKNVRFQDPETQRLTMYTTRGKMLSRVMGGLHNLSKRVPVRSSFSACGAVEVLIPFLKAEVTLYATKALLVLAYLIDEQNNHLIMSDKGPIKFLTNSLDKSLRSSRHRYLGFSSAELAEGLTQIALNDSNKKTIAECGAIPILAKMLKNAKEDEEKVNGCNTLWTLAFDAENRNLIKNDASAVTELRILASHGNSEIRKAASGALWEIEGKEKHSRLKLSKVNQPATASAASTGAEEIQNVADTKHIMISYQWDVQSSMVQLKNKLQAEGFKVWMDVDEMGGSTLESMAKAVENASVVLIGVSQKYKESPNCRSEAEYTFQLHRDIIPLMMEKKYKPDGWLGMVVGTKFWIDFSDRYKLDGNIDKLKRELGNRGSLKNQEHVQVATVDVVDAAPGPSINSWKNSDVKQWLVDVGIQNRMNQKAVERLDGPMLIRMQDMRKETPEFFFTSVRQDFGMANMFDVIELTDALDKLVG